MSLFPMMFLIITAFALLAVIAVQDYLVPKLRNNTISSGLSAPYHWYLDGSYVLLSSALIWAIHGHGLLSEIASIVSGVALVLTAVTDTFSKWVDSFTNNKHSLYHTSFTIITFLSMFVLEGLQNHGLMWALTGAGIGLPTLLYVYLLKNPKWGINPSPATEKLTVLLMCCWLGLWSFLNLHH